MYKIYFFIAKIFKQLQFLNFHINENMTKPP